jgi:hypothetical protein
VCSLQDGRAACFDERGKLSPIRGQPLFVRLMYGKQRTTCGITAAGARSGWGSEVRQPF